MKELTIEEKAKAYDEALKVLRKYDDANIILSQSLKEEMFPELKENRDEKVKKSINRLIRYYHDVNFPTPEGFSRKDLLDWIENQGKPIDILTDAVLDSNKDGLIADTMRHKKKVVTCPICGSKIENQSEPKPWSEKDEERYLSCLKILSTGNIDQPETVNTKWLKSLKDRIQAQQEWNEENLMQLDAAIHLVSSTGHIETANWLKDLKNRVQPQPKHWWSKEDERIYKSIIYSFTHNFPLTVQQQEFIKSFKDKVQPQFQQGWSEEDKVIRNALIKFVELLYSYGSGIYDLDKNQFLDWLQKLENRIVSK